MKKAAVKAAGPMDETQELLIRTKKRRALLENIELWSFVIPAAIFIILFNYLPLYGLVIAFQEYFPGKPYFGPTTKWVGFKHFVSFIEGIYFKRIVGNTVRLSLLNLAFGFWFPIVFALIVNEVKHTGYKKFVQTCSYLPYFVSTVIVASMFMTFLEPTGIFNTILSAFGATRKDYLASAKYYPTVYTVINVWKGFGFGSVLYFSTLSGIDPSLYEAARIDGANRWQQMWHVTLPGLRFVIAVQFILALGGILVANTDLSLLIYNTATYETSDVIGTYIYRVGINDGQYSYTTAVGLFLSIFGFCLTWLANKLSNWLTGFGLW